MCRVQQHVSDGDSSSTRFTPKRRLADACLGCHRSHVKCEEQRPCKRCIRRGIQCEARNVQSPSASRSPSADRGYPVNANVVLPNKIETKPVLSPRVSPTASPEQPVFVHPAWLRTRAARLESPLETAPVPKTPNAQHSPRPTTPGSPSTLSSLDMLVETGLKERKHRTKRPRDDGNSSSSSSSDDEKYQEQQPRKKKARGPTSPPISPLSLSVQLQQQDQQLQLNASELLREQAKLSTQNNLMLNATATLPPLWSSSSVGLSQAPAMTSPALPSNQMSSPVKISGSKGN